MARKQNKRRPDGLISVQVYLGRREDKSRIYKTVYGRTQKEADQKAEEIKALHRKGIDIAAQNDTFGEWADQWIRMKEVQRISKGKIAAYASHIKHLKRHIENTPIINVRTADLQNILIELAKENPNTKKPMAEQTMEGLKSTAIQIFQYAIDNRVFEYNPARAVTIPSSPTRREVRALEDYEQQWIVDTPHRAQRAAMIMMYAGLRRGELIPLTWKDIDLEGKTITVNKAVEKLRNGKFVLKELSTSKELVKSEASYREIDIPDRLVDFLKTENRESIYVCVTAKNRMHTESSWNRMWESYLSDLNIKYGDFSPLEKKYESKFDPAGVPFVIPPINPHWLRHTFCTLLYFATGGNDIKYCMSQTGHKDMKVLLDIYTHLDKKYKRKQSRSLDKYLDPKETDASDMQVVDSK